MRPEPSPLNLPNLLTFLRFLLAIVLFILIGAEEWMACIIVFCLAAITDWLDGYVARLLGVGSTLGRHFDPLVDKILVCGAFTCLIPFGAARTGLMPWMVVLVLSRELLVTSLRSYMEQHHAAFGADWSGKIKMVLQCAALLAIFLVLSQQPTTALGTPADTWKRLRNILIYSMVVATLISGLMYLRQAYLLYRREHTP